MTNEQPKQAKDLHWIGSARKDIRAFPLDVQDDMGYDLWLVQNGDKPNSAKVLKGFGGADILELVDNYDSDTYRVVYTIRFKMAVYVLHAFKKKSKQGIKTPQHEMDVILSRLRTAVEDYAKRYNDET